MNLRREGVAYLSPDLLKAQFVSGRRWALSSLNSLKDCVLSVSSFSMSSEGEETPLLKTSLRSWGFLEIEIMGSSKRIWLTRTSTSVLCECVLLWSQVKQVNGLGLDLATRTQVLQDDSRRVVP